jgi:hypothetical protein
LFEAGAISREEHQRKTAPLNPNQKSSIQNTIKNRLKSGYSLRQESSAPSRSPPEAMEGHPWNNAEILQKSHPCNNFIFFLDGLGQFTMTRCVRALFS